MAHSRETIRKALVTACTSLTTTGSNVGSNRVQAYPAETGLPAVNVIIEGETLNEAMSEIGPYDARDLAVAIEGRAKTVNPPTGNSLIDTLDDIAEEVETGVASAAATLKAAGVMDARYRGCTFEIDDEGDEPVGVVRLEYTVTYRVSNTAP